MNTEKIVNPGDIFIAYVNDGTACVGIVIETDIGRNSEFSQVLVLSWLTTVSNRLPNADVFGWVGESYEFPTFKEIKTRNIFPYDFKLEIELCENRDDKWWESFQGGVLCPGYNLIATHFSPDNSFVLMYVNASQKLMKGIDVTESETFESFSERDLLLLWAVLFQKFPDRVRKCPEELKSRNSNAVYKVSYKNQVPKIITEYT